MEVEREGIWEGGKQGVEEGVGEEVGEEVDEGVEEGVGERGSRGTVIIGLSFSVRYFNATNLISDEEIWYAITNEEKVPGSIKTIRIQI